MVDKVKVEEATRMLLMALGEDVTREGLVDTPNRVARMYEELLSGKEEDPSIILSKRFRVDNNEMVIEKDIVFHSLCEHHILPIYGVVNIGYIPDGYVVGLSKIPRSVEIFARRLQLQEQMSTQLADAIMDNLKPRGVIVNVKAEHMCVGMRGVNKPGSCTITTVSRGVFVDNVALRNEFFDMIK